MDSNDHLACGLARKTGPAFHTLHNTCHLGASHVSAHVCIDAPTYEWKKQKALGEALAGSRDWPSNREAGPSDGLGSDLCRGERGSRQAGTLTAFV